MISINKIDTYKVKPIITWYSTSRDFTTVHTLVISIHFEHGNHDHFLSGKCPHYPITEAIYYM